MIEINIGDITQEDVEAIVNAANSQLKGGGGVDGAIHQAAGPSVMEECRKIGKCPTGQAVITGAGNLKARNIIHTVGPVWQGGRHGEPLFLKSAYENSFILAIQHRLKSIAFPAVSTGVYGYPKEDASLIALTMGLRFERDFERIVYVCFSQSDYDIYQTAWKKIKALP